MKNRMNIQIANDHSVARLTFKMDSGRTETIRVTSDQLEEYIRLLAMTRMELKPPVADEPVAVEVDVPDGDPELRLSPGTGPVEFDLTDLDPDIRFSPGTAARQRTVAVRHRGLGWIRFALSDDRATGLAADLLRDLPAKG